MITFVTAKNYQELSRKAANLLSAQILLKPDCVLGLATGSSPIGTYSQLIEWYQKGDLDFSRVKTVNLDEYVGLDRHNPNSYASFMNDNLFSKVNINPANTHIPNGKANDGLLECKAYDQLIEALGGVDMQLLGIGLNGHIGFNEPGDSYKKGTHRVTLTDNTRQANSRFFDSFDDVPSAAYSMGIKTILDAKRIVLIASGKAKAQTIYDSFFGPITPEVPASALQLHNNVTVICDEDALSIVNEKGIL